jgi:hypothetical protein
VEWSGVEWSGVEYRVVQYSGEEWSEYGRVTPPEINGQTRSVCGVWVYRYVLGVGCMGVSGCVIVLVDG